MNNTHFLGRRDFLKVAAATGVVAASGSVSRAWSQPLMRVRFGYIGDFLGASVVAIANKQALWKKYGLEADVKTFTNGPIQIQALGTGDLDFGYIGPGALWLPITGRAKIAAINAVGLADRVIAQPGIATMRDLRGKTVAVPEGTSGDMLLHLALQQASMKMDDIKRVTMDPATIVSAFISKQVDAAGIWYPHVATIKARIPDTVELVASKDVKDMRFPTAFVMRNELDSDSNAPFVTATLRVIKEANDWRKANLQEAIEVTAAMLNAPKMNLQAESVHAQYFSSLELAALTNDNTLNKWLSDINKFFQSIGRVSEFVDPQRYYNGARYVAAYSTANWTVIP